jgi:signal transduction histidine kinase
VLVIAGLALAVVSEWKQLEAGEPGKAIADGAVGVVLVVCGLGAWEWKAESRTGRLMTLAGFTWFAGSLAPAALFWHRGPLVHLHISYPTGRLRRRFAAATVVVAYVGAVIALLADNDVVTVVVSALVMLAAYDVFVRTSGPARRAAVPALVAALAYAGVLAAGALERLAGWDADILFAYDVVVASVAVVLLVDLLFGRWNEATVADLVVALGQRGGTGTLRHQLSRALGDPSLEVGYWIAERERYVDEAGRDVELPAQRAGRTVTEIGGRGERVAILIHDTSTIDDPVLVAAVAAAARLAVANARLQADVRVRLAELDASRRRIVEAGDATRRRLERELSQGTERRLERVMRLLDDVRHEATGEEAAGLSELQEELRSAQAEVHDFAQGIRPSALGEGGLAAALPVLAGRVPLPVELTVDVGRLLPAVEAAVYFVCSEALANIAKHASASRVSLVVAGGVDEIVATITDDGKGGADPTRGSGLRGLADRVEALGGRLDVGDGISGGTVVTVTIPLDPTFGCAVSGLAEIGLDDERGRSDAQ